jgi:hypothetical protein
LFFDVGLFLGVLVLGLVLRGGGRSFGFVLSFVLLVGIQASKYKKGSRIQQGQAGSKKLEKIPSSCPPKIKKTKRRVKRGSGDNRLLLSPATTAAARKYHYRNRWGNRVDCSILNALEAHAAEAQAILDGYAGSNRAEGDDTDQGWASEAHG